MIELKSVTKIYENDWTALKNVSFRVEKGQFVFIIGPSGAGKSTVMKLIHMEEKPTSGEIEVAGFFSSKIKRREIPFLRRKIGVVYQDFKLLPERDAYQNIAFALEVTGAKKSEIHRKTLQSLAEVKLSHKKNSYPYQLSGGEQQKVAIARALVHEPFVLLADEPTGNIDPKGAGEILEILKEINMKGTTILMATHDVSMVEKTSFTAISLKAGEMVGIKDGKTGLMQNKILRFAQNDKAEKEKETVDESGKDNLFVEDEW